MDTLKYINRKNTNCSKWDGQTAMFGEENLLPFWVADMDFQVPGCVTNALQSYVNTGVFGYYKVPDSYYSAIINWEKTYHDCDTQKEWIRFSPGVVSAFHWIVQFHTRPKDAVLVMTPVYYPFFHAIEANDRKLVTSPLKNTSGYYEPDFADIEKKIIESKVSLLILCSPHNPVSRVWTRDELKQLFSLCKKHNVVVISDEIHQDLTFKEHKHFSALTFPEYYDILYILTAPSKTFNLAACQNSIIFIPNENLRKKWDDFAGGVRIINGNAFGYIAAEAAFSSGHEWYQSVKVAIYENYLYVKKFFSQELSQAIVSPLEGTYLLWIDLGHYLKPEKIKDFLQAQCGLAFDYGDWFGGEAYATHIRMNLATSPDNVHEAIHRIRTNIKT